MYEKTVAQDHRIYQITIPTSPALVLDLLSVADREDYDAFIGSENATYDKPYAGPKKAKHKKIPLDGYLVSNNNTFFVHSSETGVGDLVSLQERYTIPVVYWLNKTWVSAGSNTVALVRILFS
jgi:hypothetical protein